MFLVVKILLLLSSVIVVVHSTYSVHFVDHRCRLGNDTVVYELDSTVAIILEANDLIPYEPNKNCTIVIHPPTDYGVTLAVRKIDFIPSALSNVDGDYLKVYHSAPSSPTKLYKFKFDLYEKLSYSNDESMTLLYHTEPRKYGKYLELGFVVTLTAFTTDKQECDGKFHCSNGKCIESVLVCDDHNNCGDSSDESKIICEEYSILPDISEEYIVIICICLLLSLILLGCAVFSTRRNIRFTNSPERSSMEPCAAPYEAVYPSGCPIGQNSDNLTAYDIQQRSVFDYYGGVENSFQKSMKSHENLPSKPPPYEP